VNFDSNLGLPLQKKQGKRISKKNPQKTNKLKQSTSYTHKKNKRKMISKNQSVLFKKDNGE